MCEQGFVKQLTQKEKELDLMTQEISSSLLDLWSVLAQLQGIRQHNYWRREKAKLLSIIELLWILFKIRSNWLKHYLFSSLVIVPLSGKLIRSTKAEYWYKMNLAYDKSPMSQSVCDRYHYQLNGHPKTLKSCKTETKQQKRLAYFSVRDLSLYKAKRFFLFKWQVSWDFPELLF